MLQLQTKTSEGVESDLKGKIIEEVYCLVDAYPESSTKAGFTIQVFEMRDGTFIYAPPTEGNAEFYTAETLSEIYKNIEYLKKQNYIPITDE